MTITSGLSATSLFPGKKDKDKFLRKEVLSSLLLLWLWLWLWLWLLLLYINNINTKKCIPFDRFFGERDGSGGESPFRLQ